MSMLQPSTFLTEKWLPSGNMPSKEPTLSSMSPAIVAELANVLREKFKWPEGEIKARAKGFARMAEIITPKIVPNVIKDDPTDNHILACAREGQADLIVSGDKHLRRIKVYEGISIIRPTDFLHTLAGYP